jgi:hypothetical protein
LDLRESFRSMPVMDFVALFNGLRNHWGPHEENTALLLEAERYRLELDWADRTVDPASPEVKAARQEAEKAGIKPPSHPLIPPIAQRPREIADLRIQQYLDDVAAANAAPNTAPREKVMVPLKEWEHAMGLDA